ncbi:MAG: DinB family protein [Armatimonadota bacterium]
MSIEKKQARTAVSYSVWKEPRRMASRRSSSTLADSLAIFARDTAGRGNWGNPGLSRILKGVKVDEATWKLTPGDHSIWEEVNHIAYWSRFTLDYLKGRGKPTKQAWPAGKGGATGWRRDIGEASRLHDELVRRIAALDDAALAARARPTPYATAQLLLGCASHIAYHVGQIAVIRKLYRHARRRSRAAL